VTNPVSVPSPESGILIGSDGIARCAWAGNDAEYIRYHDEEWGRPVHDDQRLFEKLSLEGFQSGLSWLTILRKRENFRRAFDHFDIHKIAAYQDDKVTELLNNAGIIRHRGKINAVINNAACAIKLQDEFGSLDAYFQKFKPAHHAPLETLSQAKARTTSPQSIAMAKDMKKRGWKFIGPTTAYAFMQAMGLINDHFTACHMHKKV
tara:strand:- start:46183 stop:46800 length:618 start_codon:yes stop_codon:yes gene_type:complete